MTTASLIPTLASVVVTHQSTNYNFGSNLIECDVTPACDNKASEATLTINDSSGAYDDPSIGGSLFVPGDAIQVSIFKEGQTPVQIFNGTLDDCKVEHQSKYVKTLTLHAIDLSQRLMTRLVNTAYVTINTIANPGYTVDAIVKDLITNHSVLLSVQNGTNTSGLGLTVNNVQASSIYIQNKIFSRQSVNDCIRELANVGLANFYVDATGDVHFFTWSSIYSSVTLDDSVIQDIAIEDDGTGIYNNIYVVGGSQDSIDSAPSRTLTVGTSNSGQAVLTVASTSQFFVGEVVLVNVTGSTQESATISSINPGVSLTMSANLTYTHNANETVIADNGSEGSYNNYYAQKFQASQYALDQVVFLMHKIQSNGLVPVNNISGEVRMDNNGTPNGGATITTFSIQASAVPTGSGNETLVSVNASGNLVPGQYYWLILYAGGQDANDQYYWHTDGSTSGTHATSTDGITWTVVASSYNFVYETLVSQDVLSMSSDSTSMSLYGSRETVVTDTTIPTFQAAAQEGQSYLNVLAKKKRSLTISAFPTDTLINPGEQVKVIDGNLNAYFVCLEITYRIKDVSCYRVDYQLMAYV
ncbi:MAG: hypothetical protein ACYCQJ_15310 [Nitrososphaerales archaeon]